MCFKKDSFTLKFIFMSYTKLLIGNLCEGGYDLQVEKLKPALLQMVNNAGLRLNAVLIITSGYRSPEHNKQVGGALNSPHLRGLAVDIRCADSVFRLKLIRELLISGFTRIGIAKNFVHVDICDKPVSECIWLY
jgi:zinc D-Ala-D-Ala carboxypeptidase